jgi:hypothetical protein
MNKLKLDLDEIRVESFSTAREGGRVGTVQGRSDTEATDCTYDNHSVCVNCNSMYSCNWTCADSCACGDTSTCDFYCGVSGGTSCNAPCQHTCDGAASCNIDNTCFQTCAGNPGC